MRYLERFPEFVEFKAFKRAEERESSAHKTIMDSLDPKELLENAYQRLENELTEELLVEVNKASPKFFEKLVVELLVKMGYGGSIVDAGRAIGQSGDEGIDGIIKEDKLGLDAVYIQAKKWKGGSVGSPEIQRFIGALNRKGANKGIFVTTSTFSNEAKDCVKENPSPKVILIDGNYLTKLMYEYDVGVTKEETYDVKKIDHDYFLED